MEILNFWTFAEELNTLRGSGVNIRNYFLLYQVFIILMLILMR